MLFHNWKCSKSVHDKKWLWRKTKMADRPASEGWLGIFICFGKHYLKMLIMMWLECRFGDNTYISHELILHKAIFYLRMYWVLWDINSWNDLLFIWFSPFRKNPIVNNILNNFFNIWRIQVINAIGYWLVVNVLDLGLKNQIFLSVCCWACFLHTICIFQWFG